MGNNIASFRSKNRQAGAQGPPIKPKNGAAKDKAALPVSVAQGKDVPGVLGLSSTSENGFTKPRGKVQPIAIVQRSATQAEEIVLKKPHEPERRKRPVARLTKFLRLTVYSYLDLEESIKVAGLGRAERENIRSSEIAKEGKHHWLRIESQNRPGCLLCNNRIDAWIQKHKPAIEYCDTVTIMVGKICLMKEHFCSRPGHIDFGQEVAQIIQKLPPRFYDKKISYMYTHVCSKTAGRKSPGPKLESLIEGLQSMQENLIFDKFYFFSATMTNTPAIQDYLMSHSRALIYGREPQNSYTNALTIFKTQNACCAQNRSLEQLSIQQNYELVESTDKILLPRQIDFCWKPNQIAEFNFSRVRSFSDKVISNSLSNICTLFESAPQLQELEIKSFNLNQLIQLMEAIPESTVLSILKLDSYMALFSKILDANLTRSARKVEYRVQRGAMFDEPAQGQQGGLQELATLNEHYKLESHQVREHEFICLFRDRRNGHTILIDRHIC